MKIQYLSDLHLEFDDNFNFIKNNPINAVGDVLLIAGDLIPFARIEQAHDFFSFVSDHFKTTYWIPGNHEYYHESIDKRSGSFKESIRENVFLLNNCVEEVGEIRLVFSTLWSKISEEKQFIIQSYMNDFHLIQKDDKKLRSSDFNQLHKESMACIKKELEQGNNSKTIIITHHLPTFNNYPEKHKDSPLNEAFAVELTELILYHQPHSWIYGHTHSNTPDFTIGKTNLITNQLGYVKQKEHEAFVNDKIILI